MCTHVVQVYVHSVLSLPAIQALALLVSSGSSAKRSRRGDKLPDGAYSADSSFAGRPPLQRGMAQQFLTFVQIVLGVEDCKGVCGRRAGQRMAGERVLPLPSPALDGAVGPEPQLPAN